MIRVILLSEKRSKIGGMELLDEWHSDQSGRVWLDIEGTPSEEINQLLLSFGCDPLAISDAFRDRHPPKLEEFHQQTFLLFRGISSLDADLQLTPQQLAFFVGDNYLISFHRGTSVSINHYWDSVTANPDQPPELGSLTLEILHYACGRYLDSILELEARLGALEEIVLSDNAEGAMKEMVSYRSRLRVLRRIFNYHQLLAESILNSSTRHLTPDDNQNLHQRRDLYDRCERLYSLCAMFYEICGDLLDGHISLSSHRLNNTMKILTIITAIFVPLSFLAGIYGMNFEHMPELGFYYGYFILLGVMASAVTGMLFLFRKLKWL